MEMLMWRSPTGRLFHRRGPATAKERSTRRVRVHWMTHVLVFRLSTSFKVSETDTVRSGNCWPISYRFRDKWRLWKTNCLQYARTWRHCRGSYRQHSVMLIGFKNQNYVPTTTAYWNNSDATFIRLEFRHQCWSVTDRRTERNHTSYEQYRSTDVIKRSEAAEMLT